MLKGVGIDGIYGPDKHHGKRLIPVFAPKFSSHEGF